MTTTEATTTERTVRVPFAGSRAGRWPLTYAQRNVFDWMGWEGRGAVFPRYADLPAGHTVDEVLDAVGVLVSRHEGLRTVYQPDDAGGGTQLVSQAGHIDVLLLELGSAAAERTQITDPPGQFEHGRDFPVRMAVTLDGGVPIRAVFEFSHVTADLIAAGIVMDELVELVATPQRGAAPPVWQPPDQAEYEQTPEAKRRMARTLDYWRTQIQETPACMLSVPARTPGPSEFRLARMCSEPTTEALRAISARTRITPATILVTATATLLSWWTDTDLVVLDALYSNRGLPRMRNFIASITQSALVPFAPASSFHETLRDTHAAMFNAYRYAYFDATAVASMVDSIGVERGCPRHRDLIINDMSTGPGAVFGPESGVQPGRTEVYCGYPTTAVDPVRLSILQIEPIAVLDLTHDIRHVTNEEAEALLRSLDRLLCTAADRDIDLAALGDTVGLQRVERGEGWTKVGPAWIDVATSAALLREATGDPSAQIFVRTESGAAPTLVGYAAPTDRQLGPRELHAAMMAGLDGRHGVVAPDFYFLYDRAPDHPGSESAWQAQPVREAGSGR